MTPVRYGTCPRCGYVMFPVLPRLPCGHEEEPDLADLTEPGVVYSWTRLGDGRLFAMADFIGGALRVTAPVSDASEVAIGDALRLAPAVETSYVLHRV